MCDVTFKQLFIMLRRLGFRLYFRFSLASLQSSSEHDAGKQSYLLVSTLLTQNETLPLVKLKAEHVYCMTLDS